MHDLIRLYATEHLTSVQRADGFARVLAYYRHTAHLAERRFTALPGDDIPAGFATPAQATGWVVGERAGLVVTIAQAATSHPDDAVRLALDLAPILDRNRLLTDWVATATAAAQAGYHSSDRPLAAGAWTNFGLALQEVRRFDEAIQAHQHAVQIFRQVGDRRHEGTAWNNLGLALRYVGRFDEAIEADREGKRDVAIRHYQNAVRISPDFYPAHNNLGSDYLSKSDFAGARKEFEQVIRLNQSDANAYFNLGNVFLLMGQLSEAKEFLTEGMRRDPNSALGHYMLGSMNLKAGRYAEAERALRQAIKLNPVMAQPRLQLVNLLLQQGRKEDAVGELNNFVTTFPDSSFVAKAKEMLRQLDPSSVPN